MPNAHRAIVDAAKVRDYLLSRDHPDGRHKAAVFEWLGYRESQWKQLQTDLQRAATSSDAALERTTEYRQVFRVPIMLRGPTGRVGSIVTVWIVEARDPRPRLVTAFPGE